MKAPAYNFIKSLKKVGILFAPDRPWREVCIEPNGKDFIKSECHETEIILKPYVYSMENKTHRYYLGQCPICEKVLFTYDEVDSVMV